MRIKSSMFIVTNYKHGNLSPFNLSPFIKTKDTTLRDKIKKINMTNVQCAQCNNGPECNSDSFFENQLFCSEKNIRKWKAKMGMRVCEKGSCFIGVDKNEMGLVQGCGKCSEHHNLIKCETCSKTYCNEEMILPPPIKCYHLSANSQPYESKEKTCHYAYESCYIVRDVFWRGCGILIEQNCGDCPSKYKNCVTCNISLCNEEALLPLSTTKIKETSTSTSKITTKITSKKVTISPGKTTKRLTVHKSTAQTNKLENMFMVVTTLYSLFDILYSFIKCLII
uniref:Uncharacterized protein n=1 Tax=Meloidogyne hapla TaxID=6305 RepID=A0A1I8BEU2_MELHA